MINIYYITIYLIIDQLIKPLFASVNDLSFFTKDTSQFAA